MKWNRGFGAVASAVSTPRRPAMLAGAIAKTTDLNISVQENDDIRRWQRPWAVDDAIAWHHQPIVAVAVCLRRPSSWMAVVRHRRDLLTVSRR